MHSVTTSRVGRCSMRLMLSFLVLFVLACMRASTAHAGLMLSITKHNDAPNPVPSGQVFTYTLVYTWSGGTGWSPSSPGTLIITDPVPSNLDVMSAAPGSPVSTIVGNTVTFTLNNIVAPSGSGTVQINVRFKPGVTCPGDRACNQANIKPRQGEPIVYSNDDCVRAWAENKWQFYKSWVSGCLVDSGTVVYNIALVNPSGNDIGGLNLSNISLTDLLPPGAVLDSVTPYWSGGWSGPTGPSTGSVLLTGGPTSLTVSPGWYWYGCYVYVHFPGSSFSAGQTVTNNATLSFETPCSQGQILTMNASASNTLCDPVPPQPGGWLWKYLYKWVYFPSNPWYFPSWSPGCCGTYYIYYVNNGTATQSSIVIDDTVPGSVDVGSIFTHLPGGMSSVTMDIYCYSGGSCSTTPTYSATYTTSTYYTPSSLPPICHIRWSYTGSFSPGSGIYNNLNACLRSASFESPYPPVSAGDHVLNKVCVSGTNVPAGLCYTSDDLVTPTEPNILAGKFFAGKSGTCAPGCSPDFTGPFYPGDVLRFRMVVANVGSAAATPCTITDLLPSGFTYQGNETYYYGSLYWSSATNPSCCTMSSSVPTSIGGLGTPSIGDTNLTWTFPTLPANCNGNVDYLVIEFDAKANDNPTIPPGQYFNTFTFSATNLSTPVTSNPAQVTINGYAQVQIYKDVSDGLSGSTFSSTANVQPGGTAQYRLRIKNTGILSLSNLVLLDITPHVGDINVLPPYLARGSAFDIPATGAVTPSISGYNYDYNYSTNTKNPTRTAVFTGIPNPSGGVPPMTLPSWSATAPTPTTSTFSFRITGQPATVLNPGGTIDFFFPGTVPSSAHIGSTACNTFGIQTTPYGDTTHLQSESSPACVTVIPPDENECDSIWGAVQLDECCGFSTTILNSLGNITELDYQVLPIGGGSTPSGVVQSVGTSPCLPSSTVPSSLPGTTAGQLFFTPPCPSALGAHFRLSSTTASGRVCIQLTAVLLRPDGTRVRCIDTVCIQCDPAPSDRCDTMFVKARTDKRFSTRTFVISNTKTPSSPICDVAINVFPTPGGSGLHGGGLIIDGVPQTWSSGPGSGYSTINSSDGLPANTSVQFDLAVDYGLGWSGSVSIVITHCDGTTCTLRYDKWDAGKGNVIDIGSATDVPNISTLHVHNVTFSRDRASGKHVRSIGINYSDPVTAVVAATAAAYPCDASSEQSDCNDLIEAVHVKDLSMMVDLRRDLDDRRNTSDPVVTVVYDASSNESSTVEIIYYDETGQEVGTDRINIGGEGAPQQAVSGLGSLERISAVMGALTAQPNPTTGRCDVGFTLPSASTVDLDLLDTRGAKIATVLTGEHLTAGQHHRALDLSKIPSGTYLVSLRVNGVPSVLRLQVTK